MPVTKNALLRYKILDRCLSSGRFDYTKVKLLYTVNEALADQGINGISRRQLDEDMRVLQDSAMYNAPIAKGIYRERECYYYYEDPDFSIFKTGLSDEEFISLRSTIEMLGKYRSGNPWLEELITKLECRFDIVPNNDKIVHFEENRGLAGIERLSGFIGYALNHEAIEMTYCKFGGEELSYVFSIHCVKQYNERWYICGQSRLTNRGVADYRHSIFPIDRIRSFKKSNRQFVENTKVDYNEYFKDVVGVTVHDDVPLQTFRFRFSPNRFPYILTKPLHHSQRVVDEAERIVEITVKHNKELDQLVFSYVPDIEVLEPVEYRKGIAGAIRRNLEKYDI